jgi:hypothetical protein
MNIKELFNVESHFITNNNIVCIGKTIHNDFFLLVISISDKSFPKKLYDSQDESYCITKYKDKYYKIEVTLFPYRIDYRVSDDERMRYVFNTLKSYKKIYKAYKKNDYTIKTTDDLQFDYRSYNIPRNVWLISTGYIVGII